MKPGLKPLIAGSVLLLLGALLMVLAVVRVFALSESDETRFLVPGQAVFTIEAPARYYLWHDYQTVYEGRSFQGSPGIPDGLQISVGNAAGERLDLVSDGSISMNRGNDASQSIGYVDVPQAGVWTVSVAGVAGVADVADVADAAVFSFAESKLMQILGLVLGGAALCLLSVGAGVVFIVIGIVRLADKPKPT